ncbi:DUF11 domain-containing protein, partial [Novipirellula rosea]|uniref:COG1361 S-layer family protein n=1 Tax=Novipirellula rosea TaxID=1031540 RepID=UPI0031F0FEDA
WQLHFDGSDLAMTSSTEDITGVSTHPITGQIYFTTLGRVATPTFSGLGTDVLTCSDGTLGDDTTCEVSALYSAAANGFSQSLDALHVVIPSDLSGVDLAIAINAPSEPVVVGDQVRFALTLTNHGPATAENVVLSNVLPPQTTFVSASPSYSLDSGILNFDLGDIGAGESVQLEIIVATSQPATLVNTASVSSDSEDRVSANNTRSATVVVHPVLADLVVTQSDAADAVTAGDTVTYKITVRNDGPQPAVDVVVTNTLPADVELVSTSLPYSLSGRTLTYTLGDLDVGSVRTIDLEVLTATTGTLINSVDVTSSTDDPDATNNTSMETTEVNPPQADLLVTLDDSADPVLVGDSFSYNLTVTNLGPEPATDVTLSSVLPTGTQFVSATSGGQYDSGIVEFELGDLAVGESIDVSIDVVATQAGQLTHHASVSSDTLDLTLANNDASETTHVDPPHADLSLTISGAAETVTIGDELTYQFSITNHGPEVATGVQLISPIASSVDLVSSSDAFTITDGAVSWELGDIASGQTRQVTLTVATTETGPLSNTATVASELADLNEQNNAATATSLVLGEAAENNVTFVSFAGSGVIADIPFADEDILAFDTVTGHWSMYFDGSQLGLGYYDVNAFHIAADGSILLSFDSTARVDEIGLIRDSDIVKFTPTHHGVLTAGTFEWFLDGSDVGLSPTSGDVDAISMTPDGRLVISPPGDLQIAGVTASKEDLLVLNNSVFGSTSSGQWELYFDGSDIGLANDNLWGVSVDPTTNALHLAFQNEFSFGGVSGEAIDIVTCVPGTTGDETTCNVTEQFDGSNHGIESHHALDGIQVGSFTGREVFGQDVIYMSSINGLSIEHLNVADEDIFYHDTRSGAWKLFLDGSDVGINTDVDAFDIQSDGSVLMSFNASTTIAGLGTVDRPDIVRFIPTTTGAETSGHFEMFFDGSDVGLTTYYEDVDAISTTSGGDLLLSTSGGFTVDGVSGTNADILRFSPTMLGDITAGSWSLYFDGSDVELTATSENVIGVSRSADSQTLYVTTLGTSFTGDIGGSGADILACSAAHFSEETVCTVEIFYNGAMQGITQSLDAIHVNPPAIIPYVSLQPTALSPVSHSETNGNEPVTALDTPLVTNLLVARPLKVNASQQALDVPQPSIPARPPELVAFPPPVLNETRQISLARIETPGSSFTRLDMPGLSMNAKKLPAESNRSPTESEVDDFFSTSNFLDFA